MTKALLFSTFFISFFSFSQFNWLPLPSVPVSPSAGSVTADAGDVVMTDDGNIFTSYIWDDGSGFKLYFDQYTQGTGWVTLYSETAYLGTQTIKSEKVGNDAYVITNTGNASLGQLLQVFKVNSTGVTPISAILPPNFTNGISFDFEMGTDPNLGYLFYKNSTGTAMELNRIDFTATVVSTTASLLPATMIDGYDMTIAGDSIFMVVSTSSPNGLFLLKAGPDATTILPYSQTGELFNAAQPIVCHNPMINSDGISKVFVLGYDQGNISGVEKMYEAGTLTNYAFSGNLAQYYSPGATIGTANTLYYFNNYSPSNANPYSSYVATRDVTTGVYDTLGTPGTYVLASNSPSEHRMGFSATTNRFAVSSFNPVAQERTYQLSNNLPYVDPADINQSAGMCVGQNSTIFNNLGITDENMDPITILNIYSSDLGILDPVNVTFTTNGTVGLISNFYCSGTATTSGTVTLSIEVTDGWETTILTLPAITVISPNAPSYTVSSVEICSGQGLVNLFDYVTLTGGVFYSSGLEINFTDGIYDTDNSPFAAEDPQVLSYELTDGICYFLIDAPITFHTSPSVNVTSSPTSCNQATGGATALVSGGATPYQFSQWSSGEQNATIVGDLAAGEYSYYLLDAIGCAVSSYFEVVTSGTDATAVVTDALCNGEATGAITLTTIGLVAPIEVLWSSGHSTLDIAQIPAGSYTVNLTDATGCSLAKTVDVLEPAVLFTETTQTLPTCQVSDGAIDVLSTTGGTGTYSYAWSNGDIGPSTSNLPAGIYSLTTTDGNGCMTINTEYLSELGAAELFGSMTAADCGTPTGAIDVTANIPVGETIVSIDWSNGETTEDIMDLLPAFYTCTLTTSNNCVAIKGWNIPIVEPLRNDICVVTVDSATTTNLVVWEKIQPIGIAYYNIYRETSVQGEFIVIDTVQGTNISLFNDVVASPIARSWRYKISAVNGCEVEGPLSVAHQTIHLDVIDNGTDVSVNWNEYQGAPFSSYIVSRYTDATNWEVVATLPITDLTYTDFIPATTPGLDYMVEIELDDTCTALVWRSQDFNSARSNKEKGQFSAGEGTGDSNNDLDEQYLSNIVLAPNPTNQFVTIQQPETKSLVIQVSTVDGQILLSKTSASLNEQLDLGSFAQGIYFISIINNQVQQTYRIVKN